MSPLTSTVMILPRLKDALVTKRADRALVIAVWNYADPGTGGEPKTFELQISRRRVAEITVLDDQHGSALAEWRRMGSPAFPSREQQQTLRSAGRMPSPQVSPIDTGSLRLTLAPRGLAIIEVKP
jgi:xylan 1,4-beta-xylosidase